MQRSGLPDIIKERIRQLEHPELVANPKLKVPVWVLPGFLLAHIAAMAIGHEFYSTGGPASAFWPAAGVLLTACLLLSKRLIFAILAASFLVQVFFDLVLLDVSFSISSIRASSGAIEAVLGAWMIRGIYSRWRTHLKWTGLLTSAFGLTAIATAIGGAIGAASKLLENPELHFAEVWSTWWLGNLLGILTITPLLLCSLCKGPGLVRARPLKRAVEWVLLFAGLIAVGQFVFGIEPFGKPMIRGGTYLIFPFLSWAALRFDARTASFAILLVSVQVIILTGQGLGPYAMLFGESASLTGALQVYLLSATIPTLLFMAITADLRHTASVVQRSQQSLEGLIDHAEDRIYLVDATPSGEFIIRLMNPPAKRLMQQLGIDPRNQPIQSLATELGEDYIKDGLRMMETCLKTGLPEVSNQEFSRDGLRRYSRITHVPLQHDAAHCPQIMAIVHDTTDQMEAAVALRASEEHYRHLVENSPESILLLDPDTLRFLDVNPAAEKLFGYTRLEIQELTVFDLSPSEVQPGVLAQDLAWETVASALAGKNPVVEWVHLNANGESFPCEVRVCRLDIGQQTFLRCWVLDITDRKKADDDAKRQQRELAQADRLISLGTLVAGIAHEINNPNHNIQLNLPILERMWADAQKVIEQISQAGVQEPSLGGIPFQEARGEIPQILKDIQGSVGRISSIVSQLREYSGWNRNKEFSAVDLNECVHNAVRLVNSQIRKSANGLALSLATDTPWVRGDRIQIEQVIVNLIQNACQAKTDRPLDLDISTSLETNGQTAVLKVRDTGSGIAAEILPRITDPFFTTRSQTGGTGLGLAVASKIVEEHHGHLSYLSEQGKWTLATLHLPTTTAEDET